MQEDLNEVFYLVQGDQSTEAVAELEDFEARKLGIS